MNFSPCYVVDRNKTKTFTIIKEQLFQAIISDLSMFEFHLSYVCKLSESKSKSNSVLMATCNFILFKAIIDCMLQGHRIPNDLTSSLWLCNKKLIKTQKLPQTFASIFCFETILNNSCHATRQNHMTQPIIGFE